jgi:hypothetical protein
MYACVYNMMDPNLRMCLVSFELPRLNLGYYIYVVAMLVAFYLDFCWITWKSRYTCLTSCSGIPLW